MNFLAGKDTYLVVYPIAAKNINKCSGQIDSGVGDGELNNVQQHANRLAFLFHMDCDSDKWAVIGRCPSICRKVQAPIVVL